MASFFSNSGSLTLKVDLHGDVRRCRPWPAPGINPSYLELVSSVRSLFPEVGEALTLRYKDEDGDMCSIVEASFSDAWESAQSAGVFRLTAMPVSPSEVASMADVESMDANWTVVPAQGVAQQQEEQGSEPCSPAQQQQRGQDEKEEQEQQQEQPQQQEEQQQQQQPKEEPWEEVSSVCSAQLPSCRSLPEAAEEASEVASASSAAAASSSSPIPAPPAPGATAQEEGVNDNNNDGLELPVAVAVPIVEAQVLPAPTETPSAPASGWSFTSSTGEAKLRRPARSFAQQLVGDFKETRQDMKSAFLGSQDENEAPTLRKVGNVVGFVAGLGVAVRMAPVRATRLAAESFHAVTSPDATESTPASFQAPEEPAAPTAEAEEEPQSAATLDASSVAASDAGERLGPSNIERGLDGEVEHFAEQVKNDFKTVRHEVRDVLGYVCGSRTSIGQDAIEVASQPTEEQSTFREVVPNLASNAVGFLVAAHLVPFRAIRLGVASTGHGVSALRSTASQQ
mmetsp:Transcript_13526/g.29614  ORF Transcript_13526/g.29614 Transcript_13526/m.29614 type:complete len:511 (-) Transcript_13526:91-1623(-)